MKNSKMGFTLVELLAVIVILAIILAIAIPSITGVINSSTKSAFESDAKMVLKAIDYKLLEDDTYDITSIDEENIASELGVSDGNYTSVVVQKDVNNKAYITIEGIGKWANLTACGTYNNMVVGDGNNCPAIDLGYTYYNETKGVNEPQLVNGMTPIKWNGTSWAETTANDSEWYSYDTTNKNWANAKTADGSMWVWIPRYAYKITSGWHNNVTGTIDISFSMDTDDTRGGTVTLDTGTTAEASNNKWTNHPAFTFGDTELPGIWVAKFEPSNDGSDNVKIIPNVISWRSISVGDAFDECRSMETTALYGWGTTGSGIDSHLMKNTEWGAVAYLSKSQYGKNTEEIWINPDTDYTTGCAGDSVSAGNTGGCLNSYDTSNGMKTSTTGNIYGIYDMSGNSKEMMASYVNNGHSYLTTYGSSIINADIKYKDLYTMGVTDTYANNYELAVNKKGDAVWETSSAGEGTTSWFSDWSYMPATQSPWFARGGQLSQGINAGVYAIGGVSGYALATLGFRPVILVYSGL